MANLEICKGLKYFVAESEKSARRFLKNCGYENLSEAQILLLNEHSTTGYEGELMKPLMEGNDMGLLSDAGCPGIADPGASLVKLAHKKGIRVIPLTGPSSIVLTIMASGFNGQNFAFNGYLPTDKSGRVRKIKELEATAYKNKQAQYFIETPYRNHHLLEDLLNHLRQETLLCLGIDLTSPQEKIWSKSVKQWKTEPLPQIHKIPVVFGIYF